MTKRVIILSMVLLTALVVWAATYTTSFASVQNPISESGTWISGHAAGTAVCNGNTTPCWGDVKTIAGGHAVMADASQPTTFGDPAAVASGITWGGDQDVTVTLYTNGALTGCCYEGEVRLRASIGVQLGTCTNTACFTGYEILCNLSDQTYGLQIVKFLGPNGPEHTGFEYLATIAGGGPTGCVNGDTLRAKITGTGGSTVINVWKNGTPVTFNRTSDATNTTNVNDANAGGIAPYTGGSPGFGMYDPNNSHNVGISSFTATDGLSTSVSMTKVGSGVRLKGSTTVR